MDNNNNIKFEIINKSLYLWKPILIADGLSANCFVNTFIIDYYSYLFIL